MIVCTRFHTERTETDHHGKIDMRQWLSLKKVRKFREAEGEMNERKRNADNTDRQRARLAETQRAT